MCFSFLLILVNHEIRCDVSYKLVIFFIAHPAKTGNDLFRQSLEISFIVCQVVHHISQLSNRAKAGSLIVKTDQRDLFRAKLVQAVTFFRQISSLFAQSAQHAGSLVVCQYGC